MAVQVMKESSMFCFIEDSNGDRVTKDVFPLVGVGIDDRLESLGGVSSEDTDMMDD